MKLIKSFTAIALFSQILIGCGGKSSGAVTDNSAQTLASNNKKEIPKENIQTASFTIKGMTCAIGCAKTIQEELNGLEGIYQASVNFEDELATVSYDKKILNLEKITKVVEATADGTSYKVQNIKL